MEQAGLIAAKAWVLATLLPAAGLPLYLLTAGWVAAVSRSTCRIVALLAILAGIGSLWWLLESVAAMAATSLRELDRETIGAVAEATPMGLVLKVRLAALAVLAITILARLPLILPVLAGLTALATAAFTGHAGATEAAAGLIHRFADTLHLAAAACWIGALWLFVTDAFGGDDDARLEARLARFATTGTTIVAVLVATGLANTLFITGWPLPLDSRWSLLLALKLALLGAMLGLAALNRWRFTPALAAGKIGARARLRMALCAETACALGILGLVAALGTLDPAGA